MPTSNIKKFNYLSTTTVALSLKSCVLKAKEQLEIQQYTQYF